MATESSMDLGPILEFGDVHASWPADPDREVPWRIDVTMTMVDASRSRVAAAFLIATIVGPY